MPAPAGFERRQDLEKDRIPFVWSTKDREEYIYVLKTMHADYQVKKSKYSPSSRDAHPMSEKDIGDEEFYSNKEDARSVAVDWMEDYKDLERSISDDLEVGDTVDGEEITNIQERPDSRDFRLKDPKTGSEYWIDEQDLKARMG